MNVDLEVLKKKDWVAVEMARRKRESCLKCKYAQVEISDLPCRTCEAKPIKWTYTNFEKKEKQ